jgi:transcriptional regulator, MerR family
MKIICFLRDLDLSIEAIAQILQEEHPEKLLSLLIEQQDKLLSDEIGKKKEKLAKLRELKNELASKDQCSLESISDMTIRVG